MAAQPALLTQARQAFHKRLVEQKVLAIITTGKTPGIASNADKSQDYSCQLAMHIANNLEARTVDRKLAAQTAGTLFEKIVAEFLITTLPIISLGHSTGWHVENVGNSRKRDHLAQYWPYRHLDELQTKVQADRTLEAVLGNLYSVNPDVLVLRSALKDSVLNQYEKLVDDATGQHSHIRANNKQQHSDNNKSTSSIVHAVISCKWTMRSDRAQNSRSEALSLIRNRKGRTPHIVAVTAEPTPSRIASLALGTGDLDMIYHFALDELITAVEAGHNDEGKAQLETLLNGDRLRDISDLPLDLTL